MDKRREENLRVKENIINTLFRFMQKKSLSDITVTELVKGAGVARASFIETTIRKRTFWSH